MAYNSYSDSNFEISFWRTKTGHEVDFILGSGEVAVEVKGMDRVDNKDMRSIKLFSNDFSPKKSIIVCNEMVERKVGSILIMPYRKFLSDLWDGGII
jgi:predicted AAA+ superfamily ATPase